MPVITRVFGNIASIADAHVIFRFHSLLLHSFLRAPRLSFGDFDMLGLNDPSGYLRAPGLPSRRFDSLGWTDILIRWSDRSFWGGVIEYEEEPRQRSESLVVPEVHWEERKEGKNEG